MAKSKGLRVLSRAHTPLVLREPMPNPEKPGDAPPLRSVTLGSSGHPGRPYVTELSPEDAEVYHAYRKANPHSFAGVIEEVGDDYEEEGPVFGHEAILERAAKDKDAVKAAREGSMVKDAGPVPADALTPTNNSPPDDGPGEPRHASQPGEPEPEPQGGRRGRRPSVS